MTYHPKGKYCVVIPALNAARTVGELVQQARRHGFDVIVVNDGSSDRTAAIASEHQALVISHLRNKGKGAALRTAFEHVFRSAYDGVITMDGDGQHDPAEIISLVQVGELQHAGIALGNRLTDGSPMPHVRRWTNQWMSAIVSIVARQPIPDSQCGFRFIRKEVLNDVLLQSDRFEIETELLCRAAARRWKIISIPVRSIYHNEHSHIRPLQDTVRFFRILLWIVMLQPSLHSTQPLDRSQS